MPHMSGAVCGASGQLQQSSHFTTSNPVQNTITYAMPHRTP